MNIMIIDDEQDIRAYLMAAVEDNGYETCTVEDNEEISNCIRENKPDLIVLDIMMPTRSGVSIYCYYYSALYHDLMFSSNKLKVYVKLLRFYIF